MAKIELLLQALGPGLHRDVLKQLLGVKGLTRFVASVSFVREEGVEAIVNELKAKASLSTFLVGIRNDITSVQAVRKLLDLKVKVLAFDTASRSTLFHPKMFLSVGAAEALAVVGSANVTFSGLHNNIEVGTLIRLDPANDADAKFLKDCLDSVDDLPGRFPDHVFQIKTAAAANTLFDEGRLTDEEVIIAKPPTSSVRKGDRDKLKPIKLPRFSSPARAKRVGASRKTATKRRAPAVAPTPISASKASDFVLVWESNPLKERDLNIPTGASTHATGSMLWKKGATEDIDQRHFFRDEVFAGLTWTHDAKLPHYERSEADFTIVIKGLNYGTFKLKLSHNTSKTSKSYKQNNAMTSVSWGAAVAIIGKRDLLGRLMTLYRNGKTPPGFLIEID